MKEKWLTLRIMRRSYKDIYNIDVLIQMNIQNYTNDERDGCREWRCSSGVVLLDFEGARASGAEMFMTDVEVDDDAASSKKDKPHYGNHQGKNAYLLLSPKQKVKR